MMRSLIAIAALILLASCAETPSKPTTSGGSSSSSGKVVTATPEETFECDEDLILEPHLPEECIPPEPPEPVKPAEPDPIVGTYRAFLTTTYGRKYQAPLRFFSDGTVSFYPRWGGQVFRWEAEDDRYLAFTKFGSKDDLYATLKRQTVRGEPDLVMIDSDGERWYRAPVAFEAIKLSGNPLLQFDLYEVACLRSYEDGISCYDFSGPNFWERPTVGWTCINFGSQMRPKNTFSMSIFEPGFPADHADSFEQCIEQCEKLLKARFGAVGDGNCSDYQG